MVVSKFGISFSRGENPYFHYVRWHVVAVVLIHLQGLRKREKKAWPHGHFRTSGGMESPKACSSLVGGLHHGNLRYPPQGHVKPPRNKAQIRPY